MKKIKILSILTILFFVWCHVGEVYAIAKPQSIVAVHTKKYETSFQSDNTLSGLNNDETTQYFTLLDNWKVNDIGLHFIYTVSQLAYLQNSSITFSVNGVNFYSFHPTMHDMNKQSLYMHIPTHLLKKGVNSLTIKGDIEIDKKGVCINEQGPANWFHIYKGSSFQISYTETEMQNSIMD